MGSTTIRSITKKPVLVGYRCSNCGKVQQFSYNIVAQGESHHMGNAWGSVKRSMEEQAKERSEENMTNIMASLEKELPVHNYDHAQIPSRRCTACGNIEPWMPPQNKVLRILLDICLIGWILCFIASLICFGADQDKASSVLFIISAALFVGQIAFIIALKAKNKSFMKKRNEITSTLSEDALPLICFDPDEYIAQARIRFSDDAEAMKTIEEAFAKGEPA